MIKNFLNKRIEIDFAAAIGCILIFTLILICSIVVLSDCSQQKQEIRTLSITTAGIKDSSVTAFENNKKALYLYGKNNTEVYTFEEEIMPLKIVLNGESVHNYIINLSGEIKDDENLTIINASGWKDPVVIINYIDINQFKFYQISSD